MHARLVRSSTRIASCCALLAACGTHSSGGGAFNPNGTTASPPPANAPAVDQKAPTLPTQQIDKAVLDRYREYQRIYKQAYETNDPTPLAAVAMDPLLNAVTRDINALVAKNQIWRFTNALNPRIQGRSKDGMDVYVIDCVATLSAYRYSTKTGKRLAGGQGSAFAFLTVLRYDAGAWKASDVKQGKRC